MEADEALMGDAEPVLVEWRILLRLGLLVRGQAIRSLRAYCATRGLECDIQNFGGWIESDYVVRIKGSEYEIKLATTEIGDWIDRHKTPRANLLVYR